MQAAVVAAVEEHPEAAVLILGAGKTVCGLAVVPAGLVKKLPANEWVNAALAPCGGKGGGKPNRAQAASRDPTNVAASLTAAQDHASAKLS